LAQSNAKTKANVPICSQRAQRNLQNGTNASFQERHSERVFQIVGIRRRATYKMEHISLYSKRKYTNL